MIGYDRRSETERVWVNDEGLTILSLLKIQSTPLGNLWDYIPQQYSSGSVRWR
jgi:hypothetical protein